MTSQITIQLGKKGVTKEFLENLGNKFDDKKIKNIKVSVLRSAHGNGNKDVKKYADEIINFLGDKFNYRILGFSIFLIKLRKVR